MQKTEDGDFLVSRNEMSVFRAGLFVTICHLDPAFVEDLQTVSGYFREEFDQTLREVDLILGDRSQD